MIVKCGNCGKRFENPLNSNCPKCGVLYNPKGCSKSQNVFFEDSNYCGNDQISKDNADRASRTVISDKQTSASTNTQNKKSSISKVTIAFLIIWVLITLFSFLPALLFNFVSFGVRTPERAVPEPSAPYILEEQKEKALPNDVYDDSTVEIEIEPSDIK